MKKLLFLVTIIFIVFMIYIFNLDSKIYYLALGDKVTINDNSFVNNIEKYLKEINKLEITSKEFTNYNYRTTDLSRDIDDNIKKKNNNKEITIKNAIIKADLITITIGLNDYINYLNDYQMLKNNLINLKNDMDILLSKIRKISKEKIILIGIYSLSNDEKINNILSQLNNQYSVVCEKYDIYYLNIFNEIENNIDIKKEIPTNEGYSIISDKLIRYIKNDIIK